MEIEIRLFATFRDFLPPGTTGFSVFRDVPEGTTVGDVMGDLRLPEDIPKIIIVKAVQVREDYILAPGDVVSIFPPIGGG